MLKAKIRIIFIRIKKNDFQGLIVVSIDCGLKFSTITYLSVSKNSLCLMVLSEINIQLSKKRFILYIMYLSSVKINLFFLLSKLYRLIVQTL
jgi:hypothetical protein